MSDEGPVKVGDLLGAILAKYGYADINTRRELEQAWAKTADEKIKKYTQLGGLKRGVLEVLVKHATVLQELEGFHKEELTRQMQKYLPPGMVKQLKFRRP